jgi:ribonucleoside-diphosphate reductase alpha chain
MIHPSVEPRDISNLLIEAWRLGVKTLYYQRSTNPSQELVRNVMDCVSCES